eukprot:TRINITY_DN1817_c2_g1_i2.p4 TRINITY_DN1817_c2_g1~~TRINITY_DN1817_c2_g1_i2.p4  ORF type:complete len:221 (-),score=85.95 TRINITY_DN1817_c2_g1_i2:3171-3833(-)
MADQQQQQQQQQQAAQAAQFGATAPVDPVVALAQAQQQIREMAAALTVLQAQMNGQNTTAELLSKLVDIQDAQQKTNKAPEKGRKPEEADSVEEWGTALSAPHSAQTLMMQLRVARVAPYQAFGRGSELSDRMSRLEAWAETAPTLSVWSDAYVELGTGLWRGVQRLSKAIEFGIPEAELERKVTSKNNEYSLVSQAAAQLKGNKGGKKGGKSGKNGKGA